MQINKLHEDFDKLQLKYGAKQLNAIYGAGCIKNPNICFVFMNPTEKNVSSNKKWGGLRAPWIGTKNTWELLYKLGLFDKKLLKTIKNKKAKEWDYDFSQKVYTNVEHNKIYITNLSKATQINARPLKDKDFLNYVDLLKKEIDYVEPKVIITFGNQVSSILLNKKIQVSQHRKKCFSLKTKKGTYKCFPVYYPVGQGIRNMDKSIEDILWILKTK